MSNYRDLLKKYILHVINNAGKDYILSGLGHMDKELITKEDFYDLVGLIQEAFTEQVERMGGEKVVDQMYKEIIKESLPKN